MASKLHPADLADIEKIGTATHFNVHLRTGPAEKIDRKAKTLAAAIKVADKLGTTPGGKRPLIYAVTPDNLTVHVPVAMIAQARQEIEQKAKRRLADEYDSVQPETARKGGRPKTVPDENGFTDKEAGHDRKVATPPRRATSKGNGARPIGRRAEIAENAAKGVLPPAPDFSAETHKRFRGKLAEIVKLVEAGDVAALKAFPINPYSSSPKALDRYRNLAVAALLAANAALG